MPASVCQVINKRFCSQHRGFCVSGFTYCSITAFRPHVKLKGTSGTIGLFDIPRLIRLGRTKKCVWPCSMCWLALDEMPVVQWDPPTRSPAVSTEKVFLIFSWSSLPLQYNDSSDRRGLVPIRNIPVARANFFFSKPTSQAIRGLPASGCSRKDSVGSKAFAVDLT
jgi:hypothetical protein